MNSAPNSPSVALLHPHRNSVLNRSYEQQLTMNRMNQYGSPLNQNSAMNFSPMYLPYEPFSKVQLVRSDAWVPTANTSKDKENGNDSKKIMSNR